MKYIISILCVLMLMTSCRRQMTELYQESRSDTITMRDTVHIVQAQYDTVYMKHQEVTDMKITILAPIDSGVMTPVKQIIVEKNKMTQASAKHEQKKEDVVAQKAEVNRNSNVNEHVIKTKERKTNWSWLPGLLLTAMGIAMLYIFTIKE